MMIGWRNDEYEVEGPRPRGRPKRTWREVVREDCQARKLNKEDAIDHCKWRKVIKDVRSSGWVWVGECFFWYQPTRVVPNKRPLNGCVCVGVCISSSSTVVWCGGWATRSWRQRRCCWHPVSMSVVCIRLSIMSRSTSFNTKCRSHRCWRLWSRWWRCGWSHLCQTVHRAMFYDYTRLSASIPGQPG